MTTRVFRARSLVDAKRAAIAALGSEAVILTTREVRRPGVLGLLGGTEVEVAAASLPARSASEAPVRSPFAREAYARVDAGGDASRASVVNSLRADLRSEIRAVRQAMTDRSHPPQANLDDLASEVSALREALERFEPGRSGGSRIATILRSRGLDGRAGADLARALKGTPAHALDAALRASLTTTLRTTPWPLPTAGERAVVAAVGLSGVGKTTTLAKLAAHAKKAGLRVGFVTCDTFRVGGVEQVKRYAALLECDFDVARTRADLEACLAKTQVDLLMVDTSGRAPTTASAELLLQKEIFMTSTACAPFTRHVLLCTTGAGREVDVLRSIKLYAPACPTALALTKLDETAHPCGAIHAAFATRLPIALTCAGPRVPEDISSADVNRIVEQVVPHVASSRARAA